MSVQDRERDRSVYGKLYKIADVPAHICVYCGGPATTWDHIPPLNWVASIDLDKYRKTCGTLQQVPSCSRCNRYLGNEPLFSMGERLEHLLFKYKRKLAKVSTHLTISEALQLGGGLRQSAISRIQLASEISDGVKGIEEAIINL